MTAREVAEHALGKPLPAGAEVHHINGNNRDNRPCNLVVCQDRAYHHFLHSRMRAKALGIMPPAPNPEKTPAQLAAAALGRIGGRKTSEAKIRACRENGKKGGRRKGTLDWGLIKAKSSEDV